MSRMSSSTSSLSAPLLADMLLSSLLVWCSGVFSLWQSSLCLRKEFRVPSCYCLDDQSLPCWASRASVGEHVSTCLCFMFGGGCMLCWPLFGVVCAIVPVSVVELSNIERLMGLCAFNYGLWLLTARWFILGGHLRLLPVEGA
ncbi:hypothetical protein EDB85DRAFT_1908890 [Lactarius pseudohatsudake]|nr:hypothetical protein EDB85DRAFT_1908890 [Lactarius pseudohatsudake]